MSTPLCKPGCANPTVQTQMCTHTHTPPCANPAWVGSTSTAMPACPTLQGQRAGSRMEQAEPEAGSKTHGCCRFAAPRCVLRCRNPSMEGSVGLSPPTSPAPAAVSGEVVMGTVRCRYPSSWVPLLACHGAHGWRASSACALGRAQQGEQGGHRAPCGGKSPQGCSGDPGGTQDWRSHVCPHHPCQGPEHPRDPRQEMGQGGGCRHHGNGVAQPQRWQPRCLPTPTVSQRCLFFPGPHATEPAAPSPVTLGEF